MAESYAPYLIENNEAICKLLSKLTGANKENKDPQINLKTDLNR